MDGSGPRRIDAGDVLAALGALLLLIGLFLDWFGDANGWEAFETLDLVLAAGALAALAAAASGAGLLRAPSPRVLAPLGVVLVLVVLVQLVDPPPAIADEADPGTGAWLALSGAALVALGGLMRVARVSVSLDVGARDVRRRVPAVDRRTGAGAGIDPAGTPAGTREEAVRVGAPAASSADPGATQPFSPLDDR